MSQNNTNYLYYQNMGNTELLPIIKEELKLYLDELEKSKKYHAERKYLKHLLDEDIDNIKYISEMLKNLKYYRLYHAKRVLTIYRNEIDLKSKEPDEDEHLFKLGKLIEAIRL